MKMKLASIVVAATILLHGRHPASTRCILQVELLPQQQSRQVSFSSPFHSKSNRTFEDLWCLAKAVAARMSLPRCIKRGGWWSTRPSKDGGDLCVATASLRLRLMRSAEKKKAYLETIHT